MKALTFFVFLAVIFAAVLAGPHGKVYNHHAVLARNNRDTILTGSISLNDWLTDLIESITGSDVGKFIYKIDVAVTKLEKIVLDAEIKLKDILQLVDPETQTVIQAILDNAIVETKLILDPLLEQLERLMPAISGLSPNDISTVIKAILGKTLEEFLRDVATALDAINKLVVSTSDKLQIIADNETVGQAAAEKIKQLINETLKDGEASVKPLLDVFNQIFDIDNSKILYKYSIPAETGRRIRHYRHKQIMKPIV